MTLDFPLLYRKSPKANANKEKDNEGKKKKARVWDNGGSVKDMAYLERTKDGENRDSVSSTQQFVPDTSVFCLKIIVF